jgi:hypothetical protein
MRWIRSLLVVACLCGLGSCTTDEPGPTKCEPGSTDPELQCVAGYFCDCKPEGCTCVKSSSLTQLDGALP